MSTSLVRLDSGALADINAVDTQMQLFKRFKLSPTMVETHRFEKRGDNFALVKRERPVKLFDDGNGSVVALAATTTADQVGLNKMRGKYNDENRLFDQDCASLKVGEVASWRTI